MAKQVLQTITTVSRVSGVASILTEYAPSAEFIRMFIHDPPTVVGGVSFKQGELEFSKKGFEDVNFFINNRGELVVNANNPQQFSIDADGYLIRTT